MEPDFTISTTLSPTGKLAFSGDNDDSMCVTMDDVILLPSGDDSITVALTPPVGSDYFLYVFDSTGKLYERDSKEKEGRSVRTFDVPTSESVFSLSLVITDGKRVIVHDPKIKILPKGGMLPCRSE